MLNFFTIAIGGALGSLLRYAVHNSVARATTDWSVRVIGANFPIGTLVVNVTACLVIGLLSGYFTGPNLIREEYRLGLTVGLLGGYSTFSTLGMESFQLANAGAFGLAMLNMVLSCALGFTAVWIGYRVAARCFGV